MTSSRNIISAFIVFHVLAISVWVLPYQGPTLQYIRECLRPYMVWTGLFQSWDTFAPNPAAENITLKAIVVTQDRHLRTWTFPRTQEMSLSQRYREERYRKFEEAILLPNSAQALPDVASHVAGLIGNRSEKQEKAILLVFSTPIVPWVYVPSEASRHSRIIFSDYVSVGEAK